MARRYGYRPWLDESERYEAPFKIADLGKAPSAEPPWIPEWDDLEDMKMAGRHGIFVPAAYKEKITDPVEFFDVSVISHVPDVDVSHRDYGKQVKAAMLHEAGLPTGQAVEGRRGYIKCDEERLNQILGYQGQNCARPLQSAWTERATIALQQNGRRSAVPAAFARAAGNMYSLKNATLVN